MRKITYVKLGILIFLIISGFIGYRLYRTLKSKEAVLGKKTQLEEVRPSPADSQSFDKSVKQAVETAQKSANEAAQGAATAVSNAVSSTTTRTVETVKEYIYDRTVGSALQQINNLPKEEKEKIKEYMVL
jgi:hypothetical protein